MKVITLRPLRLADWGGRPTLTRFGVDQKTDCPKGATFPVIGELKYNYIIDLGEGYSAKVSKHDVLILQGGREMHSKINGLSFRTNIPWDQIKVGDSLMLVHDPCGKTSQMEHTDPFALMIVHEKTNFHLGFVPKETAKLLLDNIKATLFQCQITEITGGYGEKTNKGVNIKICYELE